MQWLHYYFVTEGHLTEQGSLGRIVNLYYENDTLNPGRVEGDKKDTDYGRGCGLAQWTDNSQSNRQTDLFNYLDKNGYAHDSFEGQAEFILYEINNDDYYSTLRQTLTDPTRTTSEAIQSVCIWYESPGGTKDTVLKATSYRSNMNRDRGDDDLMSPKEIVSWATGNQ